MLDLEMQKNFDHPIPRPDTPGDAAQEATEAGEPVAGEAAEAKPEGGLEQAERDQANAAMVEALGHDETFDGAAAALVAINGELPPDTDVQALKDRLGDVQQVVAGFRELSTGADTAVLSRVGEEHAARLQAISRAVEVDMRSVADAAEEAKAMIKDGATAREVGEHMMAVVGPSGMAMMDVLRSGIDLKGELGDGGAEKTQQMLGLMSRASELFGKVYPEAAKDAQEAGALIDGVAKEMGDLAAKQAEGDKVSRLDSFKAMVKGMMPKDGALRRKMGEMLGKALQDEVALNTVFGEPGSDDEKAWAKVIVEKAGKWVQQNPGTAMDKIAGTIGIDDNGFAEDKPQGHKPVFGGDGGIVSNEGGDTPPGALGGPEKPAGSI